MLPGQQTPDNSVVLRRLPLGIDWKELLPIMNKAGKCKWVDIGSNGTGYASYASAAEAQKAISLLNGSLVKGKYIVVYAFKGKQSLAQRKQPFKRGNVLQTQWSKKWKANLSNSSSWSGGSWDDEYHGISDTSWQGYEYGQVDESTLEEYNFIYQAETRTQRDRQKQQLRCICSRIFPHCPCGEQVQHLCADGGIDWNTLPAEVDPMHDCKYREYGQQKRWMVESFYAVLNVLTECSHMRVVDFGSGNGNLSLALAALLPHCEFTLIDPKSDAISHAQERATSAGLTNVRTLVGRTESFSESFDIAIALYLCGRPTDIAHMQAIQNCASYIIVPCCLGKLHAKGCSAQSIYPRSDWMRSLCTFSDFEKLIAGADYEGIHGEPGECRCLQAHDRNAAAREAGYHTLLGKMHSGVREMNEMLVGVPHQWRGEAKGEQLIGRLWEQAWEQAATVASESTRTQAKADPWRLFGA